VLALALVAPAAAQTIATGGDSPSLPGIYGPEHLASSYQPIRDQYLSSLLGLGVNIYLRGPGHMALGYAEPDGPLRAIDLSQPVFQWIYALRLSAGTGIVTAQMARSAYVLAHELGHVNARNHHSEDQANAWAAAHFGRVLSALGLDRGTRRTIAALARRQLLI
jgi:hypothetical protein